MPRWFSRLMGDTAPAAETKAAPVMPAMTVYPAWAFWNNDFSPAAGVSSEDTVPRGLGAYGAAALAFIAMNYRATKLIEAPLWIVDETDGGEEWLQGTHPLEAVLEQPNPDMEMGDLLELTSYYLDGAPGGAIWLKQRDRAGRVAGLYPFSGDQFRVEATRDRLFARYVITTADGPRDFGPDDVIHFRDADPANLTGGVSRLDVAFRDLGIAASMRAAIRSAMLRAVRPSAHIEIPPDMSEADFLRAREVVDSQFAGALNSGRAMLSSGKLTMLSTSLKGMELGPVQGDVESTVCAIFQVHPALLGLKVGLENAGSFADMIKPAQKLFYDLCAFPRWERFARALTRGLLREVDPNPRRFIRFDTTRVRALQVDMTERTTQATAAARYWTVNEARVWTGKEPFPDDDPRGEELIQTPTAPFGSADGAVARPGAARREEPEPDEQDEDDEPAKRAPTRVQVKARRPETTPDALDKAWAAFDTKATREEQPFARAALARFAAEAADIAARLVASVPGTTKNGTGHATKADDDELLDRLRAALDDPYVAAAFARIEADYAPGGEYHEAWLRAYERLIRQTVAVGGRDVAASIGVDFNLSNPRVQAVIRARAGRLVSHVTETTRDRIRDVIAQGRADGVGVREIAKRVKDDAFGGDVTRTRATTIARTESVGALNVGEYLAATESGVMQAKRWVSQRDARARPSHLAADMAGWVSVADTFPNGLLHPHAPNAAAEEVVNCRCTLVYDDRTPGEIAADEGKAASDARLVKLAERVEQIAATPPVVHVTVPPTPARTKTVRLIQNERGATVGAEITEDA